MQRAKSEYAIQTVTNALRVLEAFETNEQLGVTELARRLHLHKNNVFRLLATLEQTGYVEQAGQAYRLGVRCLELGRPTPGSRSLLPRHAPVLGRSSAAPGVRPPRGAARLRGRASTASRRRAWSDGAARRPRCRRTAALGKVLLACARRRARSASTARSRRGSSRRAPPSTDRRPRQAARAPARGGRQRLGHGRGGVRARALLRRRTGVRRIRGARGGALDLGAVGAAVRGRLQRARCRRCGAARSASSAGCDG
jgi:hypothetical protein